MRIIRVNSDSRGSRSAPAAAQPVLPAAVLAGVLALILAGCGGGGGSTGAGVPGDAAGPATPAALSAAARLGEQVFADTALSASGRQSCATCHVAANAFSAAPRNGPGEPDLPVALGGPALTLAGFRNTPTLMYLERAPAFTLDAGGTARGGFFLDGRAATLADQAVQPFTGAAEMANADAAEIVSRLLTRPYLADFEALYGRIADMAASTVLARLGNALAAFERESPAMHPYSSKFDAWRRGAAELSARELRGLALFNSPAKGNCAACHPSTSADGVTPPLFTDFSYDNLGVPRNAAIPANEPTTAGPQTPTNSTDGVHSYYDLGLCGPFRDNAGLRLSAQCGQFKVPTLRNIARTAPYFHNGRFATLQEAIGFYVRRDTHPEEWYPTTADGRVTKFDDLPAAYGGQFLVLAGVPGSDAGYSGNVNATEAPFNRHIGDAPALDAAEIDDVIAFLCALTDGYDAANPAALTLPAQCTAIPTERT
jgi:cytochrome c peroxidase